MADCRWRSESAMRLRVGLKDRPFSIKRQSQLQNHYCIENVSFVFLDNGPNNFNNVWLVRLEQSRQA